MNGGEVKTEKKEVLKVKSEKWRHHSRKSFRSPHAYRCAVTQYLEMIEGYITKGRELLFTVPRTMIYSREGYERV